MGASGTPEPFRAAATAKDPSGRLFLKRSGARKPPQAAGKKAGGEGFGRAGSPIGRQASRREMVPEDTWRQVALTALHATSRRRQGGAVDARRPCRRQLGRSALALCQPCGCGDHWPMARSLAVGSYCGCEPPGTAECGNPPDRNVAWAAVKGGAAARARGVIRSRTTRGLSPTDRRCGSRRDRYRFRQGLSSGAAAIGRPCGGRSRRKGSRG